MNDVLTTSLHRDDLISVFRGLARDCHWVAQDLAGYDRTRVLALRRAARSASLFGGSAESLLLALSRFARKANGVAHNLPEPLRATVFALKSAALSALILWKAAVVNDVSVDGTVGLDILIEAGERLHCPLALLAPPARALAKRQAAFVPVCASIFERIRPAQIDSLMALASRVA